MIWMDGYGLNFWFVLRISRFEECGDSGVYI